MDTLQDAKTGVAAPAPKLFSPAPTFPLRLKREGKICTVRFPTDEETSERQRQVRTIIHKLGPDSTVTKTEGVEEADADLLAKIREDKDGDEFEAAEASLVVDRLTRADPDEATREGGAYAIPIKVMYGTPTVHRLRIPKESEIRAYRRTAYTFVDKRHGKQQLKMFSMAVGDFYDKLTKEQDKAEGYGPDTPIPLCHKIAAVTELVQIMDAAGEEEDPETFL